jgi:hypothetical protein
MAGNVREPTMKLGIWIALGALVWICFGESARFDLLASIYLATLAHSLMFKDV